MSAAVRGNSRFPQVAAAAVAALAVLAGVFFLGRNSAGPERAAPSVEHRAEEGPGGADHGHGHEGEGSGEEGVVRFDEQALKLAGLTVEPVVLRSLPSRLAATGTVEPNLGGVVRITPRVAGKITAVRVNVGDNVRAGQVLATLASTELAAAQAAHEQARARVSVARGHLTRQRQLAGLGEFGRHKVEEARARQVAAQGEVNDARNELNASRTAIAEAKSEKAASAGEVAAAQREAASGESEILEARELVRALEAALEQARTSVRVAESRFRRLDTLLKEELVSKQDWEQAQADWQKAQSDVTAARANIAQGRAKVTTAEAHREAAVAKVEAEKGRAEQAAAKIETAQAREQQAAGRIETGVRQLEISRQALAREERVFRGGFLSSKEIVEAEAAFRLADAERKAAEQTIRLLGGAPGGGNVLQVTAPLAGRVTERTVTLGETVDPAKTLFTVINLNSVWVQLSVHPRDLSVVGAGQAVTVTSDSAPGRTFAGVVSYVGDVVDETTRTVKVRAVIQNQGGALKPHTFVSGTIAAQRAPGVRAQVLAVPREAVQSFEGKQVVFVQGDHPGEFEAREVETGDTVGGQTVVASGLEPGARVVTRGAFTVKAQAMKAELGHEH